MKSFRRLRQTVSWTFCLFLVGFSASFLSLTLGRGARQAVYTAATSLVEKQEQKFADRLEANQSGAGKEFIEQATPGYTNLPTELSRGASSISDALHIDPPLQPSLAVPDLEGAEDDYVSPPGANVSDHTLPVAGEEHLAASPVPTEQGDGVEDGTTRALLRKDSFQPRKDLFASRNRPPSPIQVVLETVGDTNFACEPGWRASVLAFFSKLARLPSTLGPHPSALPLLQQGQAGSSAAEGLNGSAGDDYTRRHAELEVNGENSSNATIVRELFVTEVEDEVERVCSRIFHEPLTDSWRTTSDMQPEQACRATMGESSPPGLSEENLAGRQFVAVLAVAEQLTKARRHFAEVIALARLFNRTVILPRVMGSRIGFSYKYPFCAYFDTQRLGTFVDWVTAERYFAVMRGRGIVPSVTFVCPTYPKVKLTCVPPNHYTREQLIHVMAYSQGLLPPNAIANETARGQTFETARTILPFAWKKPSGAAMVDAFNQALNVSLVIYSKSAYHTAWLGNELMAPAQRAIDFAPHLREKAQQLARTQLRGQYIAVHLRFEHIIHYQIPRAGDELRQRMMACARGLVQLVNAKRSRLKYCKIFVASDVAGTTARDAGRQKRVLSRGAASEGVNNTTTTTASDMGYSAAQSKTWNLGMANNLIAIGYAVETMNYIIQSLKPVVTWDMEEPELAYRDIGVRSILDKLVSADSHLFIAGERECGGWGSYEQEIVYYRRDRLRKAQVVNRFHLRPS